LLLPPFQVGVTAEPSLDDFKWATSIFWSRALGLPVLLRQQGEDSMAAAHGDDVTAAAAAAAAPSLPAVEKLNVEVWEGLVPGLDFANHSQQAKCWWEVVQQQQQQLPFSQEQQQQQQQQQCQVIPGQSNQAVRLMTNRVRFMICNLLLAVVDPAQ
jgi:hypothetical protein